ncbi:MULTISPECIES: hypothetical protein [unclassified Modestobacter]
MNTESVSAARDLAERRATLLADAWYLSANDQLLTDTAAWIDSLVVTAFTDPAVAQEQATLRGGVALRVGEAWPFARKVGAAGCSAVVLKEGDSSTLLPLLAPAHDPLTPRPTHVDLARSPGQIAALGRGGLRLSENWMLARWRRYDLLDPAAAALQQSGPLQDWTTGSALFELHWHGQPTCIRTSQLLGPFAPTDGLIVYCSSLAESRRLAQSLQAGDYLSVDAAVTDSPTIDLGSGFAAMAVTDIAARLAELNQPARAYCINPTAPRYDTAWGLAIDPETFYTVGGRWLWRAGNDLTLAEPRASWSGFDTCHYDGGVRETQLGSRFSFRPTLPIIDTEDLSPADYEEALAYELAMPWSQSVDRTLQPGPPQSLDDFLLVGWDLATGTPSLFYFRDVLEACRWLVTYERDIERTLDLQWLPQAAPAAGDSPADDGAGRSSLHRNLERFCFDIAQRGYRPEDASRLLGIANHWLRTVHLHFAGYLKDAAYDSSAEPFDLATISTGLDFPAVLDWLNSAETPASSPPDRTAALDDVWNQLAPRARSFLSSAEVLRTDYAGVPNWDAAPLVLQLCKAVEVQLHELVRRALATVDTSEFIDSSDPGDQALVRFASGTGRLELGSLGSLLRGAHPGPLTLALRETLAAAGGDALLARAFGRSLTDLRDNYRNPAAHDRRFSLAEAEKLRARWLGDGDGPARFRTLLLPQLPPVSEDYAGPDAAAGVDFMQVLQSLRFSARRPELAETLYQRLSEALWSSSAAWDARELAGVIVLALDEHRRMVPSLPPVGRAELRPNQALRRGIDFLAASNENVFVVRLVTALEDQLSRGRTLAREMPHQATLWTLLTLLSGPNSPSMQLQLEVMSELRHHLEPPARGPFVGRLPRL